jgi:pimeloyl-ACP methyl ester carboxylesterase
MAQAPTQTTPERPQTPKPPFPYHQREVTYTNSADKIQLAGTLTIPSGKGPHPAVILVPGSGPVDRNATMLPGHKPFLVIADYLARHGIAALRVDDRGVGGTTGNYLDSNGETFANDLIAGLNFLKKQSEIDKGRIGLVGHSQGAMLAPMVAARSSDVAFLIMLATPIFPDRINSRLRLTASLRAKGTTEEEINRQLAHTESFQARVIEGANDDALRPLMRELIKASYPSAAPPSDQELDSIVEQQLPRLKSYYVRFFMQFDPRVELRRVRVPVLAINGSLDQVALATENLSEIHKILREAGNRDTTVIELYGVNHLMQTATTGEPQEMMKLEETLSPKALEIMTAWLRTRVRLSQ